MKTIAKMIVGAGVTAISFCASALVLHGQQKSISVEGYVLDSACAFTKNLEKPISRGYHAGHRPERAAAGICRRARDGEGQGVRPRGIACAGDRADCGGAGKQIGLRLKRCRSVPWLVGLA